ncbi:hypothetical protein [Caldivirga sp.]|uniref:hypothetical protein n=1 Tax=Caldivirga sp. TaxID=2080243 RepID=UPI003D0ABFDD
MIRLEVSTVKVLVITLKIFKKYSESALKPSKTKPKSTSYLVLRRHTIALMHSENNPPNGRGEGW